MVVFNNFYEVLCYFMFSFVSSLGQVSWRGGIEICQINKCQSAILREGCWNL